MPHLVSFMHILILMYSTPKALADYGVSLALGLWGSLIEHIRPFEVLSTQKEQEKARKYPRML